MAAFGSHDTSPTAPPSNVYHIWINDQTQKSSWSSTSLRMSYAVDSHGSTVLFPPPRTKDEERAEKQWQSKVGFWEFVWWICRERAPVRLLKKKEARKDYGTMNGIRPVPMLC